MSPTLILTCIGSYFVALFFVSWLTTRGRKDNLQDFFVANRQMPWYLVAFGMIGTSISGVTFISVPGAVAANGMGYMQVVFGYMVGYLLITYVLLPLYYRRHLVSIYEYLRDRFGQTSYRTGAWFFLVSRMLGSAARLYLVAKVLQFGVFDALGVPFALTVAITLTLIFLYTHKGGMRTIIWTDNLLTTFMLLAVVLTIWFVSDDLGGSLGLWDTVVNSPYSKMFFFDDPTAKNFFWKEFLGGAFIAVVMTGLDQDMMQKNLSVRSLRGAQTNMLAYSTALIVVNVLFLALGVILYAYSDQNHIARPPAADDFYPMLAFNQFGDLLGILFVVGLVAAAYSSADGALTALTTSFCVDILGMSRESTTRNLTTKRRVHLGMTLATFLSILLFRWAEAWQGQDVSVIQLVLSLAGFTYGPLLGLFAFGILTKRPIRDQWAWVVCVLSPILCYVLKANSEAWFNGYKFGFELIALNGLLTFVGLLALSVPVGKAVPVLEGRGE